MSRRLSPAQEREIEQLRQWGLLFVDLLRAHGMEHGLAAQFDEVIVTTADHRKLTGMRELAKDFRQWLRDFPAPAREEFEIRVLQLTGHDLRSKRRQELALIATLLARGTLDSAEEYELVSDRVDEIYAEPGRAEEVERLNRLLNTFQGEAKPADP